MQVDTSTGSELQHTPGTGDYVQPGDWYLPTPDDDYLGGSTIVETSRGQIKGLER